MTVLSTAAEQLQIEADRATDADAKARLAKTDRHLEENWSRATTTIREVQ